MISLEKRARILAMFQAGHGRNEIARLLKCGGQTVTAIIRKQRKTPEFLIAQRDRMRVVRHAAEAAARRRLGLIQAGMVAVDDDLAEEDYRPAPRE